MNLKEQIKAIGPSVPDALYRLINSNVRYAYLKTGKGIIGFEVNLTKNEPLNGFCLIALKKHNIHAFKSDLKDKAKLILFPTVDNINDPEYGLRDLYVRKCEYFDDTFSDFKAIDTGELGEVVRDLLPPIRRVNLPDFSGLDKDAILEEVERDRKIIKKENPKTKERAKSNENSGDYSSVPDEFPEDLPDDLPFEEPDFNSFEGNNFDEDFESEFMAEMEAEQASMLSPAERLKDGDFKTLTEVQNFCVIEFGTSPDKITALLNAILFKTSGKPESVQLKLFIELLCKAYNGGQL